MEELLEDLIEVLLDAQEAMSEQPDPADGFIWIDGFGYPISPEIDRPCQ